jgi:DNA primase
MIPQSFIFELMSRVDVVDVVGRYVQLRKAGSNFLGLCPFHGEKSASFTVTPSKQFYHCFGCGAHGSAISFLMEHAGMTFPEAVADLAQGVGLAVPQESASGPQPARRDPDLLELMSAIARFYRQRLRDSPRAVAYLKGRGLTGETAARYGIGYAPDQWRGLEAAVPDYDVAELAAGGMVIDTQADDGRRRRYDRFRDRVMFPIRNQRGQVIGFGGRVIDQGEPKYMNSPETPLFSKGRELYGLFEARAAMREHDCAIVVEGYMDVVMLAQHGVGNAVATLGTATTPDHVRKLLRQVDRVVFAFDGDAAGRKAAWRALEACLPMVADTKRLDFLFLPPEHDPDSYVREHGAEGFRQLLDSALPLSGLMLRELSATVDLETPEGRARLLAEARPLLRALPPEAALRIQLQHRVAELGRVAGSELQRFLDQGADRAAHPSEGGAAGAHQTGDPLGAGRSGRDGDRSGLRRERQRGGFGHGPGGRLRASAGPPALVRRLRLLSASHPALVQSGFDTHMLPESVTEWLAAVAALPAAGSLAAVCEALRSQFAEAVGQLERDAAEGRAGVIDMDAEEARREFDGALLQVRERFVKQQIDALVAQGIADAGDRDRLKSLQAVLAALRSRGGEPPH